MKALSLLIDEYRKNWAIRYLREAESDLSTAERTPVSAISISFAIMAMRKAQTSAYYSLGDPSYLVPMVNDALEGRRAAQGPSLKLLTDVELSIRRCTEMGETLGKANSIRRARALVEIISKLVSIIVSGDLKWSA